MRLFYVIAVVLGAGALFLLYLANDEWDALEAERVETTSLRADLDMLEADKAVIIREPGTLPAKFSQDAMSEFFSRTLEAGEVLGAGVRIENRTLAGAGPTFQELKYGLRVAPVAVQAASELAAAPALFALVEEEISNLPVVVRLAKARLQGSNVVLRLEVDVFGR